MALRELLTEGELGISAIVGINRAHLFDQVLRDCFTEVGIVVQDLDADVAALHDNRELDGSVCRASEVVRAAPSLIAVEGALGAEIPRVKNLKDVEFSASRRPAGAFCLAILQRARDLSVEHPQGWHVGIEALRSVRWHGEFKEESLLDTVPTICFYFIKRYDQRRAQQDNLRYATVSGR